METTKLWARLPGGNPDGPAAPTGDAPQQPTLARRTFMQLAGFAAAGLTLQSCRPPEQKIVPFLTAPVEMTPGTSTWYASTCGGCPAACGLLVKVRDGRPIKVEGNPDHPLTRGALCPVAHAMVFDLYDSGRLKTPSAAGTATTWQQVDTTVTAKLNEAGKLGRSVRLLTGTEHGPTTLAAIERFLAGFPDARHITYDAVSVAAILEAHRRSHGSSILPTYRFDRARVVVSFDADFLGTWIAPAQHTRDYSEARAVRERGSGTLRHLQVESHLSLTGANADARFPMTPAEGSALLVEVASQLAARAGIATSLPASDVSLDPAHRKIASRLIAELWAARGAALVVCGYNDPDAQYLVNILNDALDSYGATIDLNASSNQRRGSDAAMADLVAEMEAGKVGVLLIAGVNPSYDYRDAGRFNVGLRKVPFSVSFSQRMDETSSRTSVICPVPHFLESWGDAQPVAGLASLFQPAIAPLLSTRSLLESLLRWSGDRRTDYMAVRDHWREHLMPLHVGATDFDAFWDGTLQRGCVALASPPAATGTVSATSEIDRAVSAIRARAETSAEPGITLVLYEKVALRDGAHATSPWLQELPDPISKITWDNYAAIGPDLARRLAVGGGDVVALDDGAVRLELPVHVQQGVHPQCVAVALGYGRTSAGAGSNVGVNAFAFVTEVDGFHRYNRDGVTITPVGRSVRLATTQPHESQEGRDLARRASLESVVSPIAVDASEERAETHHAAHPVWPEHEYKDVKWGMAIDLNACTGCGACVLSCQAENNIPVVGRQEVINQREMHWLRIDRYFDGSPDNPTVDFQPIMCAQCDNASCENVCPVLATLHSADGLNMQVYNRCVGTRYCANNCALKTRRFNWFNYEHDDPIANLALNPDVTVRSRGVMEKCTFCVQRIQEAKIAARNEARPIESDEVSTACQQSCPARAISFGNMLDPKSDVVARSAEKRGYEILEELNLKSAITYLATVRSTLEA